MVTSRAAGPITVGWRVDEILARYSSTGPIFLQGGRLYVASPGSLYASYPGQTLGEYAARGGLAVGPLLALLNAAADSETLAGRTVGRPPRHGDESRGRGSAPPVGSIGYTGSYREPSLDVVDVSVVSTLEGRGPQ